MITIGITGGVGAGKSSVLNYIKNSVNCEIVMADDLAKELETPGGECFLPLLTLLGDDILNSEGYIDNKLMAQKIFSDSSLLDKVNDIVHPAVKASILDRIDKLKKEGKMDFFFLEAALLIECGYKEILDELWYIYASEDIRRTRLKESRGYSDSKIDGILSSQLADEVFKSNCDFIIDNSFELSNTYKQIDDKFASYNFLKEV